MSKTLLSTLIASLFVAAPALAQSDDPMRVEGTATIGGIYNNQNASDSAKLEEYQDLGNGVLSSFGAQGRSSAAWFQGYAENIGRSDQYLFLRGGHVRRLQGRRVPERHAAQLLEQRDHALQRRGRQHAVLDVPAAQHQRLEPVQPRLRPPGYRRVLRVAEEQPVVLPRRRQPGEVRRHEGRLGGARHEPGQRLHRAADPGPEHHGQLRRRRRLPDDQGHARAALGLQQVQQRQRAAELDEPVLRQPAGCDPAGAGQHLQQVHADGQLPRPAVALGDLGALHLCEDGERHRASPRPR